MKTKILTLAVVLGCSGVSWADRSGQEQLELVHQLQDKSVGYDGLKAGNSDSAVLASAGAQDTLLAMNQSSQNQSQGAPKVPEPAKESNPTRTKGIMTFFLGGLLMLMGSVFKSKLAMTAAVAGGLTAVGAVIALIGIIYMMTAPESPKQASQEQASA